MRLHVAIAMVGVLSTVTSLYAREWTDRTGRHRTEAELVGREGDRVVFVDRSGRRRVTAWDRLSLTDQEFVLQSEHDRQAAGSKKPGLVVNTLGYRRVQPVSAAGPTPVAAAAANKSVFKLTGWSHCTPWYCHHPHPPKPPKPPLPVPSKRIYCGKWSTWHLVLQAAGQVSGSGTYLITLPPPAGIVRHLVLLEYVGTNPGAIVYKAVAPLPPSGIPYWRFSNSAVGSCWYQVHWSMNGTTWNFYEYCQVKLPL